MKFFLSICILITTPVLTFANDVVCEMTAQEFAPVFVQTLRESYKPLMCSDNVFALLKSFKIANSDLSNAQVVVIRHKAAPHLPLAPQLPRLTYNGVTYGMPKWGFHVFVVVDGLVFDMDYTEEIQVVGVENYMKTMWLSDDLKDYVVQVKDFSQYVGKDTFGVFHDKDILPARVLIDMFSETMCTNSPEIKLKL